MKLAFGTDEQVGFEILSESDGAAAFALGPKAFSAYAALFGRRRLINRLLFPLEPSHFAIFSCCGHLLAPSQPTQLRRCGSAPKYLEGPQSDSLIVYTTLGENALGVRVFHFFHF